MHVSDFIYHFLFEQKNIRIKIKNLMDPIKIKGSKLKKKLLEVVTKVRRTNKKNELQNYYKDKFI